MPAANVVSSPLVNVNTPVDVPYVASFIKLAVNPLASVVWTTPLTSTVNKLVSLAFCNPCILTGSVAAVTWNVCDGLTTPIPIFPFVCGTILGFPATVL